jgi:hypothetical protein
VSFSIHAAGSKDQVRRQLGHAVQQQEKWNNDTTQIMAVVGLIEHHLAGSAYTGGVLVEANGHHDTANGNLSLTIRPLFIPAEPEPEPETAAAE